MLEKILKLSEEKKAALGGIYDIRDESDRTGMRAVIELKKDTDAEKVLGYLLKYSDLQVTFGVNMVAIAEGKPRTMSLRRVIRYYIRHQKNVVTARTRYELDKAKARAHILEGLMVAVDNLDEVIALIRRSKTPKEAKQGLMERFALTEPQAQAILDLRLQRLTGLEIEALRREYAEVLRLIEKLTAILADERKLMKVIKDELREIAQKYGDDRRTTVAPPDGLVEAAAAEETRVAELATVTYTRAGYLRRMYPKFYQKLPAVSAENGNWDDMPLWRFDTDTDRTLYLFTNLGNCHLLQVGALAESNKPAQRGSLLTGVLPGVEAGEVPVLIRCATPEELAAMPDLLFVTRGGQLKRTAAAEYDVRRQKFAALNLREGDSLLAVLPLDAARDLLLISRSGMSLRCHADALPAMGRATGGVRGMALDEGDELIFAEQPDAADTVLLMSERGFGKRVLYLDFEPQARGGKGVKAFYFNKSGSNGSCVAGALLLGGQAGPVLLTQKKSPPSLLDPAGVAMQGKQDKGQACVMAILDDVVTGLMPCPASRADAQPGDGEDA